ncbi:hypothetical protein [Streptomonospora salina]|uniref:Uncharacterized protein n=1 Tax=Streptomonospora salina TaxID=104205 RepID=A0A841EI33_9ACTN|nr:hypothetical protein [Streptomonospora salina]MBB5999071.1 hypothetical protein [Streptomonospora salina]
MKSIISGNPGPGGCGDIGRHRDVQPRAVDTLRALRFPPRGGLVHDEVTRGSVEAPGRADEAHARVQKAN